MDDNSIKEYFLEEIKKYNLSLYPEFKKLFLETIAALRKIGTIRSGFRTNGVVYKDTGNIGDTVLLIPIERDPAFDPLFCTKLVGVPWEIVNPFDYTAIGYTDEQASKSYTNSVFAINGKNAIIVKKPYTSWVQSYQLAMVKNVMPKATLRAGVFSFSPIASFITHQASLIVSEETLDKFIEEISKL